MVFNWPSTFKGKVIVIGIANSLDLTERLLPKLNPNIKLEAITFPPYTKSQLIGILETHLSESSFDQKAIELCARKVSAITGDVRNAFGISREMITSIMEDSNMENIDCQSSLPSCVKKTSDSTQNKRKSVKRPLCFDISNITSKKDACTEVLNSIKKVYSSPCRRSKLPLHQRIILATLMKLVGISRSQQLKSSSSVGRDHLSRTYFKVCERLKYTPLNIDELDSAYSLLSSQAMISIDSQGNRILFQVEMDIARDVINDNTMLSYIETMDL